MRNRKWRVVGLSFDHMHMGDLLRLVHENPDAEIVGICDSDAERMQPSARTFGIDEYRQFSDPKNCLEATRPDIAIICSKPSEHAAYTELAAEYGANIIVEKPMAASLQDALTMVRAADEAGVTLAINWPLAWYPPHITTKRFITEGLIGNVTEVHYYDGNRGPLYHTADKVEISAEEVAARKSASWWYQLESGGGSLRDYLGYGVTLGTWFHGGKAPIEVTTVTDSTPGLEVDEHSVSIARYDCGLSKFETRWGTFTDPWTHQPQPRCGFVVVGTEGTISSYDYQPTIRIQTRRQTEGYDQPVDTIEAPYRNPLEYVIHCIETTTAVAGPLSPAMSCLGQRIVDTAILSDEERRTVPLI